MYTSKYHPQTNSSVFRSLEMAILKARDRLNKLGYKQDFDKRFRFSNCNILDGRYIYLDPRDGEKIHGKLGPIA